MLVSKLQDEQLIDRMLILPTPAHFKQKMKEFKLISITHNCWKEKQCIANHFLQKKSVRNVVHLFWISSITQEQKRISNAHEFYDSSSELTLRR